MWKSRNYECVVISATLSMPSLWRVDQVCHLRGTCAFRNNLQSPRHLILIQPATESCSTASIPPAHRMPMLLSSRQPRQELHTVSNTDRYYYNGSEENSLHKTTQFSAETNHDDDPDVFCLGLGMEFLHTHHLMPHLLYPTLSSNDDDHQ